MTDIIVREVTDDAILGERAHLNYGGILEAKSQVGRDFLVLGRLLKDNRDKKYFKALGYDTFEDFLGSPDIAMSRSMVFDLIRAVEVFIDKLARPMDELAPIGISKLSAIAKDDKEGQPVVYQDVEEWMGKAKELSRSDLQEEVHEATGNPIVRRSDVPRSNDWKPIGPGQRYLDYVRDVPCCICGKPATEGGKTNAAHFPVSRGAGAPADWVIPMCGDCHAEHHHDPATFMVTYQQKWAAWFFRTLKMYDDALKSAEETLAAYTTDTTEDAEIVVDVVERSVRSAKKTALQDTTDTTKLVPPLLSALFSSLPKSGVNEENGGPQISPKEEEEEEEEREGSGSVSGAAVGLRSPEAGIASPARLVPPPTPSNGLKQIWPPEGGFDRCYKCHMTLPVVDLEGGLCESCRASAVPPATMDGLAFPKPVAAKRRGKKGGSK